MGTVSNRQMLTDGVIVSDSFNNSDMIVNAKHDINYYIRNMANELKVDYTDLFKIIAFETANTFRASIKNPYSGAVGLIQFTNSTARTLYDRKGKKLKSADALLAEYSTFSEQMELPSSSNTKGGPVYQYLSRFGAFKDRRHLYLAVFYPIAINMSDSDLLPEHVALLNPGIITVGDYCSSIDNMVRLSSKSEYD